MDDKKQIHVIFLNLSIIIKSALFYYTFLISPKFLIYASSNVEFGVEDDISDTTLPIHWTTIRFPIFYIFPRVNQFNDTILIAFYRDLSGDSDTFSQR